MTCSYGHDSLQERCHCADVRLALITSSRASWPTSRTITVGDDGSAYTEIRVDGHRITMTARPTIADADPAMAERAVANLVHNALRHGHEPGAPAQILVDVAPRDTRALVTVTDTGPGLRPPIAETGLGLALVRWIAKVHDGSLLLDTSTEPGTRIRLVLNIATAQGASRRTR